VAEAWYKGEILAMLCWITILGGVLIMMGQHSRSEALFYFRLEDQVPETHLLRLIEKHISFAFVREKLEGSYSETVRPSIDPELLLRILLIGYLLSYSGNLLVENRSGLIVDAEVFQANGTAERDAELVMMERLPGTQPLTVGGSQRRRCHFAAMNTARSTDP
jgi:hypothetical protein